MALTPEQEAEFLAMIERNKVIAAAQSIVDSAKADYDDVEGRFMAAREEVELRLNEEIAEINLQFQDERSTKLNAFLAAQADLITASQPSE